MKSWHRRLWIVLLLVALPLAASAAEKTLVVRNRSLNAIAPNLDGQWQGMTVASDGNCYFACSSHTDRQGAIFCRYDPRADEMKVLCDDMTKLCGEDVTKTPPQGKVHSPIIEANGKLYFCTHIATYWPEAMEAFTGAHVLSYDLGTGEFHDYGVLRPRYSIYSAVGVDPKRQLLYAFVTPFAPSIQAVDGTHIYRLDLRTGEKTDLGLVRAGGPHACFWFFVDDAGDCWFVIRSQDPRDDGTLYCVRGETGKIERFVNAFPPVHDVDTDKIVTDKQRWFQWAAPLPGGDKALIAMASSGRLYTFDPKKLPALDAFKPALKVGANHLGAYLVNGRYYYVQREDNFNRDDSKQQVKEFPDKYVPQHLFSAPLDPTVTPRIVDYGEVTDQEGRRPWRLASLAADGKGHVFMTGEWLVNPGEHGALRRNVEDGKVVYKEANYGMFFGEAEVGE